MNEIWKVIDGYDNYQVSNFGNIMNTDTGKLLKGQNNGKGYLHVALYDREHKCKTIMIHRLVAKAFIPNPNDLPQVNHIDECKTNNCVDNLEWVTSEDNINHGTHNMRVGINNPNRKPICSIDIEGNIIYFDSAEHAVKYYNSIGIYMLKSGISQVLTGKSDTYKNLAWFEQTDIDGINKYYEKFNGKNKRKWKKIYSISCDGIINYFESMQSALKFYCLPKYQSVYLRSALDKQTEFNGMKWFYCN